MVQFKWVSGSGSDDHLSFMIFSKERKELRQFLFG
jgi:hypothetical protein